VEHYFTSGAVSFPCGFRRGAKMGKNRECQAIRQRQQLTRGLEVSPEIVNNNGGVKDATHLPHPPAQDLLPVACQMDISDSPPRIGPGFTRRTYQAVLLSLLPESRYDGRINFRACYYFNGRFRLAGETTSGRLDPELRPSDSFDSILDISCQFPSIRFAQGCGNRPSTVAGTNGES